LDRADILIREQVFINDETKIASRVSDKLTSQHTGVIVTNCPLI